MVLPLVWVFGAVFAGTAVQQVLKPRLPAYQLDVRILQDPVTAATQHVWIAQGSYYSAVPAAISFFNENFLNLDVHALHFDLFYMDWDGRLERIGELKDRQQVEQRQQQDLATSSSAERRHNHNNTQTSTAPLWSIPGRANFTVHDTLYVGSLWSCLKGMMFNSRFYWSLWKGGGHLALPTTGVAHVRANGQARLTVTFVCDNLVDTWTLRVQGVDCQLRQLSTGWTNMTHSTDQLRAYAIENLVALESGHVVTKRTDTASTKTSNDSLQEVVAKSKPQQQQPKQ